VYFAEEFTVRHIFPFPLTFSTRETKKLAITIETYRRDSTTGEEGKKKEGGERRKKGLPLQKRENIQSLPVSRKGKYLTDRGSRTNTYGRRTRKEDTYLVAPS
jgi:hypothetical protein